MNKVSTPKQAIYAQKSSNVAKLKQFQSLTLFLEMLDMHFEQLWQSRFPITTMSVEDMNMYVNQTYSKFSF